jgi:hypothetical protein
MDLNPDKMVPHNVEAEEALLGSLLIDPLEAIPNIAGWLKPRDFYIQNNAWVYEATLALQQRRDPVDFVTLCDELERCGHLDDVGGAAYVTRLMNAVPSAINAAAYGHIIEKAAIRRRLLNAASRIAQVAYREDGDLETDVQQVEAEIKAACQRARPSIELSILSADDILTTEWPEPVWAIPGLLPAGLSILAGKAKAGKSWLALQIAQAVASGGMALGERVQQGPVLYLALEDPPARLKERMQTQNWPRLLPADFMPLGKFMDDIGDLRNGGGQRLAQQIEVKAYRLVVIDTLSRAISGDQSDVGDMTIALTPIQEMAHALNCAVVMVDHHRKGFGTDADAVGDILGSTAKGAMADCVWGLYRERGKKGAKLLITGRDIVERDLSVTVDWTTGCWQVEGDAGELELTARRQEILDALEEIGPSTLTAISKAIDQPKSNTHSRLQDLTGAGLVRRYTAEDGGILYAYLLNLPDAR